MGISALREFSINTNAAFVDTPIKKIEEFLALAEKIRPIGRSNIKDLGYAAFRGVSQYRQKLEFVHSRYPDVDIPSSPALKEFRETMRMIADISTVYDIWFKAGDD